MSGGEILLPQMSPEGVKTGLLCLVMWLDCLVIISLLRKQVGAQDFFRGIA